MQLDNKTISETPWGQVDKPALGAKLADVGGPGDPTEAQIREVYAYVPAAAFTKDPDGDRTFHYTLAKLPHHEIRGGKIVLNRAGVHAAYAALQGGRGGVDLQGSALAAAKAHIRRHYVHLGEQPGGE